MSFKRRLLAAPLALALFATLAPGSAQAAPRVEIGAPAATPMRPTAQPRHKRHWRSHVRARRHGTRRVRRAHAAATTSRPAPGSLIQPVLPPEADVWLVTLNVKLFGTPRYLGGSELGFIGYPTLNRRRFGDPVLWSSPDDSVGYSLYESARFSAGPVIAYRGGRYREDEGRTLAGVHKTPWTLEGGVFADLWLVPDVLRTRAEIRRGFRDRDGFVVSLGADVVQRWGRFTGALGPRLKFGDDHFTDSQFGVREADAVNNPTFQSFQARGGLTSVGAYGSLTFKQNETWSYTLQGGYDRLVGDAEKSPIVRRTGNANQFTVGAVVSYSFEWAR